VLEPGSERCPRCGELAAALTSAPPFIPDPQGVPVVRYRPATVGPPVAPEPYLHAGYARDDTQVRRHLARMRIVFPQPRPRRARAGIYAGLTLLLAALVLVGLAAGVLARGTGLLLPLGPLPLGAPQQHRDPSPPPTATPSCPVAPVDTAAAQRIAEATLTTGLRAPESQDYRPVDSVSTFRAGQRAYITYLVKTAEAGTVDVTFCTPAGAIPGTLDVPAGSAGRYGQFSLVLDANLAGPAVATLTWNGAVAASLPFTVAA
jgi:hypothetical protein